MNLNALFIFLLSFVVYSSAQADLYIDDQSQENGEIRLSNVPVSPAFRVFIRSTNEVRINYNNQTSEEITPRKRLPYDDLVSKAAVETQLAPALIHAVIAVESQHNPMALSARGAAGLMQLMPGTAKDYRVSNPFNPKQNIFAGARYLKYLIELFEGDIALALAAYNAGPEKVKRYGMRIPPYAETQAYVARVLKKYQG